MVRLTLFSLTAIILGRATVLTLSAPFPSAQGHSGDIALATIPLNDFRRLEAITGGEDSELDWNILRDNEQADHYWHGPYNVEQMGVEFSKRSHYSPYDLVLISNPVTEHTRHTLERRLMGQKTNHYGSEATEYYNMLAKERNNEAMACLREANRCKNIIQTSESVIVESRKKAEDIRKEAAACGDKAKKDALLQLADSIMYKIRLAEIKLPRWRLYGADLEREVQELKEQSRALELLKKEYEQLEDRNRLVPNKANA